MVEAFEATVLVAPSQGHVEIAQVLHAVLVFLGDRVVLGDEDDDVGAGGLEGMGQGARDIA